LQATPLVGHAFVQVRDTVTGEAYILSGGWSKPYTGGALGAVTNSSVDGVKLSASVRPQMDSPEVKTGDPLELIDSQSLGNIPIAQAVRILTDVRDEVKRRDDDYKPQTVNSNVVAATGFKETAGRKADASRASRAYPGINDPMDDVPTGCGWRLCPKR